LKIKSALLSWVKLAKNFENLKLEVYETRKKNEQWKLLMNRAAATASRSKEMRINASLEW